MSLWVFHVGGCSGSTEKDGRLGMSGWTEEEDRSESSTIDCRDSTLSAFTRTEDISTDVLGKGEK